MNVAVPKRKRIFNRRYFLVAGTLAGFGGAWVATSSSWSAGFIRDRLGEIGRKVPAAGFRPVPATWRDNGITLAWLGHATVLVNFYGVRILTDPAFFPRIGVDLGVGSLGPKRLVACALSPTELPEIDLVLLSHAHFDHLDRPSLAALRGRPQVVMSRDTSDLVPADRFAGVKELRWDERVVVRTPRGELAVAMADAAGARFFVPIHHQTFKLSNEPVLDPIERTQAALAKEAGRIALKDIGETAVIRG